MSRLVRFTFIALVVAVATAGAADSDFFRNPTAGFEITKPAKWLYATADFTQQNLRATKLNDQELHAAMLKYATTPMVAMLKFPEPYEDINPSFKVNIKPLGGLKGKSAAEIINVILPQLEKAFKDHPFQGLAARACWSTRAVET